MAIRKTVLLVARDAASLQAREEQLREHGFATRFATDADELQVAFQHELHGVDVAVVGAGAARKRKIPNYDDSARRSQTPTYLASR